MARRKAAKPKANNPRPPTTPRRRRSRRPRGQPSVLKTILRSIYQVVSALPVLPAPVKAAADWTARYFGVTSTAYSDVSNTLFDMNDGAVNTAEWSGFVRTDLFVTGTNNAGAFSEHLETLTTNIKAIRPLRVSFTLKPQNPMQSRAGYYTMAFFPSTGPESYNTFSAFDKAQLGYERLISRAPVKGRWPATSGGSLTYTVPKTNAYLHNGVPLRAVGVKNTEDVVGFLVIVYKRDDRTEYNDFTADQVAFDLQIRGTAVPSEVDPVTPQQLFAARIIQDFNSDASRYLFRNEKNKQTFALDKARWNPKTKAFEATQADARKAETDNVIPDTSEASLAALTLESMEMT